MNSDTQYISDVSNQPFIKAMAAAYQAKLAKVSSESKSRIPKLGKVSIGSYKRR